MDHLIEEEISEHPFDPHDALRAQTGAILLGTASQRRGAPRIPPQWTRVISLSTDNLDHFRPVAIETDQAIIQSIEEDREQSNVEDWQPIFFPRGYIEQHQDPQLEDYRIASDTLAHYAIVITRARTDIREHARRLELGQADNVNQKIAQITKLSRSMTHFGKAMAGIPPDNEPSEFIEHTPALLRKRSRVRKKITDDEMASIVHKVIVQGELQIHVAKEFRVTSAAISNIVKRFRCHSQSLAIRYQKRQKREEKANAIKRTAQYMIANRMNIEST